MRSLNRRIIFHSGDIIVHNESVYRLERFVEVEFRLERKKYLFLLVSSLTEVDDRTLNPDPILDLPVFKNQLVYQLLGIDILTGPPEFFVDFYPPHLSSPVLMHCPWKVDHL